MEGLSQNYIRLFNNIGKEAKRRKVKKKELYIKLQVDVGFVLIKNSIAVSGDGL